MTFDDTPEEAAFRRQVRDWIAANKPDDSNLQPGWQSGSGDEHAFLNAAKAWQKRKAGAGWACLHWPKEYGGGARTPIERAIWKQEEAPYAALSMPFLVGEGMAGPTIMAWADEEARRTLLPALISGEEIWCQLFSEPAAGSDLAGLRTRAERAADGSGDWIVNGQKIWTSGAQRSDWGLLLARTDPDVPKHKGLTAFFVSMHAPGVDVRPIRQISGRSEFNEVFLTDVRVPDAQRLGAPGQGWDVSLTTLMNERMSIAELSTGLPELFAFCSTLQIDGRPAIEDPAIRSRLAEFAVIEAALRNGGMRVSSALSRGEMPGPENSVAKLVWATATQDLAGFALELLGESGVVWDDESPLGGFFQLWLMRSPGRRIGGGSDEILRNIIAERVLGLPAEVRVDKDVPFRAVPSNG